jgi:hypothetical protein
MVSERRGHELNLAAAQDRHNRPGPVGAGSQFGSHSPSYSIVRGGPAGHVSAGHELSWHPLNPWVRTWKACWGQPLTSSNLVSSARLTRQNAGPTPHRVPARRRLRLSFRLSWAQVSPPARAPLPTRRRPGRGARRPASGACPCPSRPGAVAAARGHRGWGGPSGRRMRSAAPTLDTAPTHKDSAPARRTWASRNVGGSVTRHRAKARADPLAGR